MEIFVITILVLLNGIFAMSEMSLVSSKRFKLENEKNKGSAGAKKALELFENPTKFLSTVQIGITLIGVLLGVYSGENVVNDIVVILNNFEYIKEYSHALATIIIVFFITFLSIVIGELLPKRLGMTFPEKIIILLAKPMYILSLVTSPFVWLLTHSSNLLSRMIGLQKISESKITEEEIKSIIKESVEDGEVQEIEQNIVERVFEFGDRKVNSLFTHRTDIVYFKDTETFEEIVNKVNEEKHSVYPVISNNNLDEILGIVLLKDLFSVYTNKEFNINEYLRQPLYINENLSAYKVLEIFKKEKIHYAIIIDEYGSTIGIITMDDIMDALIGDFTEIYQEDYKIVQRNENSWFIDAQYPLIEFFKYFNINSDEYINENFTTVAGLVIHKMQTLPNIGDKCFIEDFELEIVDKDGQRIDKIIMTKLSSSGE